MKTIILLFFLLFSFAYSHPNSFGVGIINSPSQYLNQDDKNMIIPILNYKYNKFYIRGLEVGFQANKYLSFITSPKLNKVEFQGIETRKRTIEAGLKLSYPINKYKISFGTLFDTLGIHDGYNSSLKLSYTHIKFPFIFIPNIGIEYQDKNLSNYYYGINLNESFQSYQLSDTINKTFGFVSIYNINKKYALNLIYNYKKLDKKIQNSPIVNKNNKQFTLLSFVYKF